jgi:DNA polymerase-3 subunit epsilon
MTRGQKSLIIETQTVSTEVRVPAFKRGELKLIVLRASAEEIAAHEAQLVEIDKASGGALWRRAEA